LGASGSNTDPFDRQFDYGLSDNDLPYVFKFTPVYSVPEFHTNRFASLLTSGWYLSSILTWQSGFPFSIFSGKDNSLSGVGNDRADLAAGTNLQQAGLDPDRPHKQLIQEYFNTSAFTTNEIGTFATRERTFCAALASLILIWHGGRTRGSLSGFRYSFAWMPSTHSTPSVSLIQARFLALLLSVKSHPKPVTRASYRSRGRSYFEQGVVVPRASDRRLFLY
jgi:hypothetical protein